MTKERKGYAYSSYEKFSDIEYDEAIFSDLIEPSKKDKFIFKQGRIITRGVINKKKVVFSDNAINQAVTQFRPHPALMEHKQSLFGMVGTVVKYTQDNGGLNLYAAIPKTKKNEEFIELMENDIAGLIRLSIGGMAYSIKCSICDEEVFDDFDHMIGRTYKIKGKKFEAYGIVDEWETRESTFTLFPADTGTFQKSVKSFSMGFSTGFDDLDENLQKRYSETFINPDENTKGDSNMADDNKNTSASTPNQPDFEAKFNELTALITGMDSKFSTELKAVSDKSDSRFSAIDDAKKDVKVTELVGLIGEDKKETLIKMDDASLDLLLSIERGRAGKKREVPGEAGEVDDSNGKGINFSSPQYGKDTLSIILGFKQTYSEMSDLPGVTYLNFNESPLERAERVLSAKYTADDK